MQIRLELRTSLSELLTSFTTAAPMPIHQQSEWAYQGQPHRAAKLASTTNTTCYDPMGRLSASSQTTGGLTYDFSYAYNLGGQMTSQTLPSGQSGEY